MSRLDEAKEISLVSYLSSIGYEPKKSSGNKTWFLSPIHNESAPSFVVNGDRWVDYGATALEKPFGDVVDLCQEINSCSRMEAIDFLLNGTGIPKFEQKEIVDESKLNVVDVLDQIKDQRLIDYLNGRCIPENIYKRYLKEVRYSFSTNPDKIYTACGFKNDLSGWEIRSRYHKYVCSPKHITSFGSGRTLNLFEGSFNFFSALCYFGVEELQSKTIVLNGLGLYYRIADTLNQYDKINCFLDFGVGAENIMNLIRARVGVNKVFDNRCIHNDDEDLNDFWCRINKK